MFCCALNVHPCSCVQVDLTFSEYDAEATPEGRWTLRCEACGIDRKSDSVMHHFHIV